MTFSVGSLVKARGREWVVLPESSDDLLVLRPLGGSDDEITGVYTPLEEVSSASFTLPDPNQVGDFRSARLLRDALRLGFRSSAGPFRSFARLGFEPRPYQLVPLLMALKLDPVRILISDDVGIGKTIEAGLIARELKDRGEIERLAVLCPPPLAEQWQKELREKFHIEADLVLASTAARLEPNKLDETIFDHHPFTVVSTDFIKSERRREQFLRTCPELVIVDEAHTCAFGAEHGGKHQRHQLISGLAKDPTRHIILVTATPHSGKEEAFRSLLSFLDKDFENLPEDLTGTQNERYRRRLAQHFIQRRRADIRYYMQADTPFPERKDREESYKLSPEYRRLFEKVLDYARETVQDTSGGQIHQRVRWWSALALLRSLASSPAAAALTLRTRATTVDPDIEADSISLDAVDENGRRMILDRMDDAAAEGIDITPGVDLGGEEEAAQRNRRRLMDMAREADKLLGEKDEKLKKVVGLVKELLADGYRPILFCRFIATAEYLADELRRHLPKDVEIVAVTGSLPPVERVERVEQLSASEKHVLVATDCLSEGINLQENFDSIIHYDLSWNPTRHEQREGRVDRFGQKRDTVRMVTYYGVDNQIDGVVLEVLLRKHNKIRSSLGISVPVPVNTEQVVEAIFEGLLLKGQEASGGSGALLPGMEDYFTPQIKDLYGQWEGSSEREKRSHTMFAQASIKVDEVAQELTAVQSAIGSGVDVEAFTKDALTAFNAVITGSDPIKADLSNGSSTLKDLLSLSAVQIPKNGLLHLKFSLAPAEEGIYLTRTHPFVETLANHVLETALDPLSGDAAQCISARRCGVMRTTGVSKRTTLLLVRFRYHIIVETGGRGESPVQERPLLAEDCQMLAFTGAPDAAQWLPPDQVDPLLQLRPDANVTSEQASDFIRKVNAGHDHLVPHLEETAIQRGKELLDAHQRVRTASRIRNVRYRVEPQLPPDLLGIFVFLPKVA